MGVPPSGSGHSPKGGAASSTASPAKPSVPNAEQIALYRAMHSIYEICLALNSFMNSKRGSGADGQVWQELHKISDLAFSAWGDATHFMRTNENLACPHCVRRADEITLAKWGPEMFEMLRGRSAAEIDQSERTGA